MDKSSINIEDIAKLSRLDLGKDELDKYARQMGGVLEYVSKLSEARPGNSDRSIGTEESSFATSGESFATPEESLGQIQVGIINGVSDVMREDEIGESLPREKALKNAPAKKDGFIQVKAVFAEGLGESS